MAVTAILSQASLPGWPNKLGVKFPIEDPKESDKPATDARNEPIYIFELYSQCFSLCGSKPTVTLFALA